MSSSIRASDSNLLIEVDQAQDPLILTIDVGTSSVRATLYDGLARSIRGTEVQSAHHMTSTADGGVETAVDELFERVCGVVDGVLARNSALNGRIAAIAPTTFWHNVTAVDGSAVPLSPLYTWADTRSRAEAVALRSVLDEGDMHLRTGCFLHPSYLPAKISWLRKQAIPGVRYWLSFADLMMYRLFGEPCTSVSMASGSGLLNQHTCRWDDPVLEAIGVEPGALPALDSQPRSGLREPFAARWPALARVPWYPAWGDGATNNVGSGAVTSGRVAMMVGTSGAMRSVHRIESFTIAPRLWCYRIDAQRIVTGGALSNGGNLLQWMRETLRLDGATQPGAARDLDTEIALIAPDSHGLTVLPFLAGERSPNWAANATGAVLGLRIATRPEDIMRAGYEAIAYQFGLIFDLLRQFDPSIGTSQNPPVIASGAALLSSPTWMQMMADVLGTPVAASEAQEGSSRGASLLALEALNAIPAVDQREAPLGERFAPQPNATAIYAKASARQQALYGILIAHPPGA